MSKAQNNTPAITRFGTIEALKVRRSKGQRYAVATVNCKVFKLDAYGFGDKMVERLIAAGEGAKVFMKVVMQPVQVKNADGRTYSEERAKIVFLKDNTADAMPADDVDVIDNDDAPVAEETPVAPATPDDLTVIKGIGAAVAEKLNTAGVETYAALAEMTDEALDAVAKGTAKRATSGNWRAIAAELASVKTAETAAVDDNEEIPF